MSLPKWLTRHPESKSIFYVDRDVVYSMFVKLYKLKPKELTQYWIEVIYQSMKLEVQLQVAVNDCDPRIHDDTHLEIRFLPCDLKIKEKWKIKNFPDPDVKKDKFGKEQNGVWWASKGLGAKTHYKKLRNVLPQ